MNDENEIKNAKWLSQVNDVDMGKGTILISRLVLMRHSVVPEGGLKTAHSFFRHLATNFYISIIQF